LDFGIGFLLLRCRRLFEEGNNNNNNNNNNKVEVSLLRTVVLKSIMRTSPKTTKTYSTCTCTRAFSLQQGKWQHKRLITFYHQDHQSCRRQRRWGKEIRKQKRMSFENNENNNNNTIITITHPSIAKIYIIIIYSNLKS